MTKKKRWIIGIIGVVVFAVGYILDMTVQVENNLFFLAIIGVGIVLVFLGLFVKKKKKADKDTIDKQP